MPGQVKTGKGGEGILQGGFKGVCVFNFSRLHYFIYERWVYSQEFHIIFKTIKSRKKLQDQI